MSVAGGYVVREIHSDDFPGLPEFYEKVFPQNEKLNNEELWGWEFERTPNLFMGPSFYVLTNDQSHIAGGIGCLRREMQVGNMRVHVCHPVDYFVSEDAKGFPALRLFRAVIGSSDVFFASYVSDDAARLAAVHGFLNLDNHVKKYNYSLGLGLHGFKGLRFFRSLFVLLARKLLSWSVFLNFLISRKNFNYSISAKLEHGAVPSEDSQMLAGRVGLIKSFDYLRWRYQESPVLRCKFISQTKLTVPNCLFVVHEELDGRSVVLLDVVRRTSDVSEIAHGLLMVIRTSRRKGYKFLSTVAMNPILHEAFVRLGFGVEEAGHRFIYYAKEEGVMQAMSSAKSWDFIIGDTDVY